MNANPTSAAATSMSDASGSPTLTGGQAGADTHTGSAPGHPLAADQRISDTHARRVGGDPSESPVQTRPDTHSTSDGWLELRIWAEMFNDAQQQRIASVNRAERGGVDPAVYAAYTEAQAKAEKVCGLHMRRCYRRVVPAPIVAWQKATPGIGEHLLARLLGQLGHPVWTTPHHWEGTGTSRVLITDPPFARTVSQLWQYCGHGDPARSRPRKGMSADDLAGIGSPACKMVVHLLAEACMKTRTSPFRLVYEQARVAATDKPHGVECVRCGPSGKPAQPGTPWSPGHQHAHALRIVGKELLRDLWTVAGGQSPNEPQCVRAPGGGTDGA